MTKRNLTLGTASGRLGSVVYFRRRGQQSARVLVSSVNDKKTLPQCYVRARFACYVNLWRSLRPYIEQSWRSVSRYGSPENAFAKHNRGLFPTISKEMSRAGYAFPSFGLITYGSLPIDLQYRYDDGAWLTNIPASSTPQTIGNLSSLLLNANIGIREGDVFHFLAYAYSFYPQTFFPPGAMEFPPAVIHYAIKVDRASAVSLSSATPNVNWRVGEPSQGFRVLGTFVREDQFPADGYDVAVGIATAYFVERPTNPQYSRFTRSRFIMQSAEYFYLYPMATMVSNVASRYASTWQSIQ